MIYKKGMIVKKTNTINDHYIIGKLIRRVRHSNMGCLWEVEVCHDHNYATGECGTIRYLLMYPNSVFWDIRIFNSYEEAVAVAL